MAKVSSKILTVGMVDVAKILAAATPSGSHYAAMGVGNIATGASSADTDLKGTGTNVKYAVATASYSASNKGKWVHTWSYGDLAGHIFKEVVICISTATHASAALLRATYNTETLGTTDTLQLTVTCEVKQGS